MSLEIVQLDHLIATAKRFKGAVSTESSLRAVWRAQSRFLNSFVSGECRLRGTFFHSKLSCTQPPAFVLSALSLAELQSRMGPRSSSSRSALWQSMQSLALSLVFGGCLDWRTRFWWVTRSQSLQAFSAPRLKDPQVNTALVFSFDANPSQLSDLVTFV